MRVKCEYCGGMIDVKIDDICPICGAAFDKSFHLNRLISEEKEKERMRLQEAQLRMERQKLENDAIRAKNEACRHREAAKNSARFSFLRILSIIPFFIVITVMLFAFFSLKSTYSKYDDMYGIGTGVKDAIVVDEPVVVSFLEEALTSKYSVICNEIEECTIEWREPPEGYKHVALTFVIKNASNNEICPNKHMVCFFEKDGQMIRADNPMVNFDNSGDGYDGGYIRPGESVEYLFCFTVPKNADLIIKYDDNITILIDAAYCVGL